MKYFCFRQVSSGLKQESFYLTGENNTKFSIIKNDSVNTSTSGGKSTSKIPSGNLVLIPTNDENETSQVNKSVCDNLELFIFVGMVEKIFSHSSQTRSS